MTLPLEPACGRRVLSGLYGIWRHYLSSTPYQVYSLNKNLDDSLIREYISHHSGQSMILEFGRPKPWPRTVSPSIHLYHIRKKEEAGRENPDQPRDQGF